MDDLLSAVDEMLVAFAEGVVWSVEQKAAYTRLHASLASTRPISNEEVRKDDIMIGEFIARWEEAADGVVMDADTAEALAREFKRMQALIYIPGVWCCAKCGFRLVQSNLNAHDGSITACDDPGEKCPNDGSPLWRVTYRDDVAESYERWEEQVERAVAAEQKLEHLSAREAEAREIIAEFGGEFAETFVDDEGWKSPMKSERIVDWFGPSYFHRARNWLKAGEAEHE